MTEVTCSHSTLTFQYTNTVGNAVNQCADCRILVIKKPQDEQLYTLDKNLQLVKL